MSNQKPSFRFEIDNFSKKESAIKSQTFLSGGCEWYLYVHPKGNLFAENHLSLSLYVANIKSLITGWKRNADFYFVVLNQSDKELYRTLVAEAANNLFCAKTPGRVFATLPLSKLQEKGVLVNDKLIIEVYINVVDEEGEEYVSKKKRVVEINGFQVLASQFTSLSKLFDEHPDIAKDFKLKNQVVKTEYMNVLLNLIEAVEKPSKNQSYVELGKARSELSELMEVGFKLDWLKSKLEKGSLESLRSKLEEISLGKKKAEDADRFRVQKLEERLKNLELMGLESLKPKLEDVSLEMKKAYDADRPRVQQLGERFKNIELMESGLKMDSLKSKLKRVSLEMKKAKADGALVQKLEERLKNLEVMELGFKIDCLKSKFEEDSLERNQSYDADGSRVKQLEESVKNLEKIVFELKVELDKKKDKSSADGFLLVDEVA